MGKVTTTFLGVEKREPAINFGRFGARVVTEHNILRGLIDQSKFSVCLSVRGLL